MSSLSWKIWRRSYNPHKVPLCMNLTYSATHNMLCFAAFISSISLSLARSPLNECGVKICQYVFLSQTVTGVNPSISWYDVLFMGKQSNDSCNGHYIFQQAKLPPLSKFSTGRYVMQLGVAHVLMKHCSLQTQPTIVTPYRRILKILSCTRTNTEI